MAWGTKFQLGLELNDAVLKVVELSRNKRGLQLAGYAIESLPKGWVVEGRVEEQDNFRHLLTNVLERERFHSRKVQLAIGSGHVQVRRKTYPYMKKNELKQVIYSDVTEHMRLPFSDPWYDIVYIKKPRKKGTEDQWDVLLVIASESFIRAYVDVIRATRLKPMGVDVASLAVHRWLTYVRPKQEMPKKALIAKISPSDVDVSIFEREQMALAWGIPLRPGRDRHETCPQLYTGDASSVRPPTEAEITTYTDQLTTELKRALYFYEDRMNKRGHEVDELILTGEGVPLSSVRHQLAERLHRRITILSAEPPIAESLIYRPISQVKTSLCLPTGLAMKGLIPS